MPRPRGRLSAGMPCYPSPDRLLVPASPVRESSRWPRKDHENFFCMISGLRSQIQYLLLQSNVFRLINRLLQDVPSAGLDKIQYCCLRQAAREQDTTWPAQKLSCQMPVPKSAKLPSCLQEQTRHNNAAEVNADQKSPPINHYPLVPYLPCILNTMLQARRVSS